jgi:hypothetical protein
LDSSRFEDAKRAVIIAVGVTANRAWLGVHGLCFDRNNDRGLF